MSKLRLLFVKEGPASYISNLDLLRTVQRAFPRTELDIRHSQGFHPHPIISIVLPLPVGQSSDCELLDFEVTQETDGAGIAEKLNGGLPEGLTKKRTKRKQLAEVDIAPMIRDISFTQGENVLRAAVTVQAQNPGLNPQLLEKAIARYLPELTPDFVRVRRRELLDADGQVFR